MLQEIILKYKINKKEIKIFGTTFVSNNKTLCKLEINNKEKELTDYYAIDLKNENENTYITIKLIIKDKIINLNDMFYGCENLIYISDIPEIDSSNTNISFMFYDCKSLKYLPDISKWNTIYINIIFPVEKFPCLCKQQ